MSYAAIDTIVQGTRTAGDIRGQISCALIKQATTRIAAIGQSSSLEAQICRTVLDGAYPVGWTIIVLGVLDTQGHLNNPTDAFVDTAVVAAWSYLLASRSLG